MAGIEGRVYHMAIDRISPGYLLFSDNGAVKLTNGSSTQTIAGQALIPGYRNEIGEEARFTLVMSFVHLNDTHLILADSGNYCLRLLNLLGKAVTDFIGACTKRGREDGVGTLAKFLSPWEIVRGQEDHKDKIFVMDKNLDAIRSVNIQTKEVTTLIKSSELTDMDSIAVTAASADILIAISRNYIREVSISAEEKLLPKLFKSDNIGSVDGPFSEATFLDLRDTIPIARDVYLIASDQTLPRLRVVDLSGERVSSICMGQRDFKPGEIDECQISQTYSLLLVDNMIYIGGTKQIYTLSGENPCVRLPTFNVCK